MGVEGGNKNRSKANNIKEAKMQENFKKKPETALRVRMKIRFKPETTEEAQPISKLLNEVSCNR